MKRGRIGSSLMVLAAVLGGCALEPGDTPPTDDGTSSSESALTGVLYGCYGAHGSNCDGIPGFSTLQPEHRGGNICSLPVTVGAQYHDACCSRAGAQGTKGYLCDGIYTGTNQCKPEFERAANDQLYGYTWRRDFDVTIAAGPSANAQIANFKAPSNTKIAVNDAQAGFCQNGWYYINLWTQAKCK
jgi:hypothetical protein